MKEKTENNSNNTKQDGFDNSLGLTPDEIKIIESYRRLFTGMVMVAQSCNIHTDLNTVLESYYKRYSKQVKGKTAPIQFRDWDDLFTIFKSEDKLIEIVFFFSHLNKLDINIDLEERLKHLDESSAFFKALKTLENTHIKMRKIIEGRDAIKDLLVKIFQNISSYSEQKELISKLHENILVEAHKLDQVIQSLDFEIFKIKDIYGIDNNSAIVTYIQEIKCFK